MIIITVCCHVCCCLQMLTETPFFGIPGIVRFIDVRTQWFDDCVAAAQRNGIKQIVIIAAGYDTRAYRLSKPGARFYEVDMPEASRKKQELVRKLLPADKLSTGASVSAVWWTRIGVHFG
jgi:methyltransferase (TIGR00027 family)